MRHRNAAEGTGKQDHSIGNAAGEGARIAALNTDEFERSKELAAKTEFLELAMDPEFQDVYVDELEFPE